MQFLTIKKTTTLAELSETVGDRNVDYILAANNLTRTPKIGKAFTDKCNEIAQTGSEVTWQRKIMLLNTLTGVSDMFEDLALASDDDWKVFSALGTLPGLLKIPETVTLKDSAEVRGTSEAVETEVYNKAFNGLRSDIHKVDPSIFNKYSDVKPAKTLDVNTTSSVLDVFEGFNLPWGQVTLYSSLADSSVDFPVYPEELSDGVSANYTTMSDIIYQYEPWQVFQSSGPRTNTYTFKFHRDMWTGDHKDGMANNLIRFCEANCYPRYNGSAVSTSTVALYIAGNLLIQGVLTDVNVDWSGPIGHDGWYLYCELSLRITEVSPDTLSFDNVAKKSLIG